MQIILTYWLNPVNIKYTFLVTIMYAIWTHFLSSLFNWGGDKKHVEISTQWNQEGRFFTADHIFIDPICAGWVVPELWRGEVIILQWQPPPAWPVFPGLRWPPRVRGCRVGARGRHNVVNLTFSLLLKTCKPQSCELGSAVLPRCLLRVVAASVGFNNSISSRHATGWVPQAVENSTLSYN